MGCVHRAPQEASQTTVTGEHRLGQVLSGRRGTSSIAGPQAPRSQSPQNRGRGHKEPSHRLLRACGVGLGAAEPALSPPAVEHGENRVRKEPKASVGCGTPGGASQSSPSKPVIGGSKSHPETRVETVDPGRVPGGRGVCGHRRAASLGDLPTCP